MQHNLGADKKEAFERFYQLMRQPQKRVVPSQSLVAVVDAFLDWVKINRSADTFEWYRYRLQRFCQRYPDLRTTDLKPFHVQQWVDSYPDLGRTSQRNYLRSVKRCCKWAVQQGYLTANPVEHLEVPTADRRERRVTTSEHEQLLSMMSDESMRDLVITTWETGCRPQESLRVEARHVELEHQRWVFPKSEAKGKRQPRTVNGKLIPKTVKQLGDEACRKVLARFTQESVPGYSLYSLRHSCPTRALQSGLDGLTVAILMGHSDPSTLARVYQHLSHEPEHFLQQARRAAGKW